MGFLNSSHGLAFTVESLSLKMLTFSGSKIENWYSLPLNPNSVRDGVVTAPQEVGKVMATVIREKGVPRSEVISALPSTGSSGQLLTLPKLKAGKMEPLVTREMKRLMPGSAEVDYFYWQAMSNGVAAKDKQAVYALAVPRNNVINMVETCRNAGMKLRGLELRPFALARAVNCKSGIIIHGEVDTVEIVIVDRSFPGLFRNIPVKDVKPSLEAAWQNIIRELPFTLDYYNRSHSDSGITAETPIYLSGSLALDSEVPAKLAQATGRKVSRVEPPPGCPQDFPFEQYLVNVGLMLKAKW